MSQDEDIKDIQQRIAKAEADQGSWRASGNQEKYLESFFRADALGHELDQARKRRLQAAIKAEQFVLVEPPAAPKASEAPRDPAERERLMAEYSITASGRQYQFSHYRYDRFEDALGYAIKQRTAPSAVDAGDSLPPPRVVETQDETQRRQMTAHGITFDGGAYHLGPYRYDRLEDALDYSELDSSRGLTPKASLS